MALAGGLRRWSALVVGVLGVAAVLGWWRFDGDATPAPGAEPAAKPAAQATVKPALTVTVATPRADDWAQTLVIDGNVVAWQEAVIGAELAQYRIAEVLVQVGDRVKKGQMLARIADDAVASELAEAKASVAELEAAAGEAKGNAERAQALRAQGFYSTQMNTQYATAERTASARLSAARARLQSAQLRMLKTRVTAPDDGVISARAATVGSLTQPGQELFRLIRGGRLEWQAEIPAAQLARVKAGAVALLAGQGGGEAVRGTVRTVSPSVDPRTRNGIVYVDLPADAGLRAGMFARGEIETGRAPALTVPQAALVLREGFGYVFGIVESSAQTRVEQIRVKPGRRSGERVEIVEGLNPGAHIVVTGAGFLADGDVVSVATANEAATERAAP